MIKMINNATTRFCQFLAEMFAGGPVKLDYYRADGACGEACNILGLQNVMKNRVKVRDFCKRDGKVRRQYNSLFLGREIAVKDVSDQDAEEWKCKDERSDWDVEDGESEVDGAKRQSQEKKYNALGEWHFCFIYINSYYNQIYWYVYYCI